MALLRCLVILVFSYAHNIYAQPEVAIEDARIKRLASSPTWLRLLHYEGGGKRSVVLTDAFFLSANGRVDPEAELEATIQAYYTPWTDQPDSQARCRFPARYWWLARQLDLPGYNLRESRCQRFIKWALYDSVKSVSLLLVGGFFGNPASTFGHALLKFNTDSEDDTLGLFDLTVNYGAMVPENEFPLRYAAKGILGGYEASFSDRYFYTQDMVYTRTEFRDVWDYRLNLTEDERTLLILHIWEILGNKFDYYFIGKNCAYRLAELIQLAIGDDVGEELGEKIGEDIVSSWRPWYLPVELFYRLDDIDKANATGHGQPLVESVSFIPSSERVLYNQLSVLSAEEMVAFNLVVKDGAAKIPEALSGFSAERQIVLLDSLLAYQQYLLVAEQPNPSQRQIDLHDQILLSRLKMPPHVKEAAPLKELPSPADGARPLNLGVSMASEAEGEDWYGVLNWTAYDQSSTGRNSLQGDEFVVMDVDVGIDVGIVGTNEKIFIDQFDLLRIMDLRTTAVDVVGERNVSWQLRLGAQRVEDSRYDALASFGVGKALGLSDGTIGFAMLDLAAHCLDPVARIRPHLGLISDLGAFRAALYVGVENSDFEGEYREVWGGKAEAQLWDLPTVRAEVSNERATTGILGLSWNF